MNATNTREEDAVDKETFVAESEANTGMMYRVARSILQNDADCQDAVQDALLKAWANRAKLREDRYFRTWMTRILINSCHDILRKTRPTLPLEKVPEQGEDFPDRSLAVALERLPEKYRLPLTLCYAEHMTLAEAGRALHMPVSTVQSRVRRGIERLRGEMEDRED